MAHEFFDELRSPNCKLPSANPMPVLFDFSDHELNIEPRLNSKLIPQKGDGAVNSSTSAAPTTTSSSTQTATAANSNLTTNTAVTNPTMDQNMTPSSLNEPFSQKATITPQKTTSDIENSASVEK